MWVRTLLALLLCAVSFSLCSQIPPWVYHFVDKNLTWIEAQQFCRQHYHDLACVSSSEDNLRLPRPPGYSAPVWIGVSDDPTDLSQWKWTATNSSGSYKNWGYDGLKYVHEPQQCISISSTNWITLSCSCLRKAVCYSGSSPKVYHSITVVKNWSEALTYCRKHHKDLALIENAEENAAASNVVGGDAWIGLSRSTWKWSDNRAVTFTAWSQDLSGYKIYHKPLCAAQNMQNTWEVFPCQERRPFYCQEEPKAQRVVKMKFSGNGLDDPAMNQQILDEILKRFEAAGHTYVKIKWKTVPEKHEEKEDEPEACPLNV